MKSEANDLERLRTLFSGAVSARGPVPSSCPAPEELWDGADESFPALRRREIVAHLAECSECATAWRLARELTSNAPASAATELGHPSRRWALGLAAAAVLAVVIGVAVREQAWRPTHPTYRALPATALRSLTSEERPLPRSGVELAWTGGEPGARYDLRVSAPDLTVLFERRGLTEPHCHLPAEIVDRVPAGGRLLWQVEAESADGARLISPTFVLRLE